MNFKKAMIGLDFTSTDQSVLNYASFICKLLKIEEVYFVHIVTNLDLGKDFLKEYNADNLSADEKIIEKLKDVVNYNFAYSFATLHFEVHEGKINEEFLHWIKIKNIDLVFMGRKPKIGGSGMIPGRIVRNSGASLLLVPEEAKPQITKMVVPIDFSDHSKKALKTALDINSKNENGASIFCENVYFVPSTYYKSDLSYFEFGEIIRKKIVEDFEKLTKEIQGNYSTVCILDDDSRPADKIYDYALNQKADLIVMGGKGRTASSSVLMGSVAEKLITHCHNIPLLIIKNKNEKWGFWEALKNL